MARYNQSPIYRKALELIVFLEKAVRGFSRYDKYSIEVPYCPPGLMDTMMSGTEPKGSQWSSCARAWPCGGMSRTEQPSMSDPPGELAKDRSLLIPNPF